MAVAVTVALDIWLYILVFFYRRANKEIWEVKAA